MRDVNQVKSALQYWQSKGVIAQVYTPGTESEQSEPVWTLLESNPSQAPSEAVVGPTSPVQVRETPAAAPPLADTQIRIAVDRQEALEAVKPFGGFIQNALANLHSLPSTRLHSMMSSLAPGYAGRSLEELEVYLEVARSEGLLVKGKDGFWRLAAL